MTMLWYACSVAYAVTLTFMQLFSIYKNYTDLNPPPFSLSLSLVVICSNFAEMLETPLSYIISLLFPPCKWCFLHLSRLHSHPLLFNQPSIPLLVKHTSLPLLHALWHYFVYVRWWWLHVVVNKMWASELFFVLFMSNTKACMVVAIYVDVTDFYLYLHPPAGIYPLSSCRGCLDPTPSLFLSGLSSPIISHSAPSLPLNVF